MRFRHYDLDFEVLDAQNKNMCGSLYGLPHWLQTCKQMCAEALETISRAMTLGVTGKVSKSCSATLGSRNNPLVFRRGGIRHISIQPTANLYYDGTAMTATAKRYYCAELTKDFLSALRRLYLEAPCLEVEWRLQTYSPGRPGQYTLLGLDQEPNVFVQEWDRWWSGRFRRVEIIVNLEVNHSYPSVGDVLVRLAKVAEACATKLVGKGGIVSWEDPHAGGLESWRKSITVERRV